MSEIDRPRLVGRHWLGSRHAQMTQPVASPPSAQGQSFLAIDPLDALVIGLKALAAQHQVDQRTAPAPSLLGQLAQPLTQQVIAIFPWRRPESAPRDPDQNHRRDPAIDPAQSLLPLPFDASPWVVAVFCEHVPQRPKVEGLVCDDCLEPPILFVELPQPAHLRNLQPAALAAPSVESRIRDTVPPTQLRDFCPGFRFFQTLDDLFFAKPCSLHACLPYQQIPTYRWNCQRGKDQTC